MSRKFEVVREDARTAFNTFTDEKKAIHKFVKDIKLPVRSDEGSAGYDFFLPSDVRLLPTQKTIIWTDVKCQLEPSDVLMIFIRSSLAIKQGLMISNNVGIIDSSYYGNEGNDGNIAVSIVNTTGKTVDLAEGERFIQGIIVGHFKTDDDEPTSDVRTGGIGSSGK